MIKLILLEKMRFLYIFLITFNNYKNYQNIYLKEDEENKQEQEDVE